MRGLLSGFPSEHVGPDVGDTIHASAIVLDGKGLLILGPSGSGKTTLLGLCAGLDHVDEGSIELCGVEHSTRAWMDGTICDDQILFT